MIGKIALMMLVAVAINLRMHYLRNAHTFPLQTAALASMSSGFSEPPPEGGLDLVTNRQGAI